MKFLPSLPKLITYYLLLIIFLLFPPSVFAQKFDTDLGQFQRALGGNNYNKETFDFQSLIGVSSGLYTMLAGCKSSDSTCPQGLRTGAVDKLGETIADIYAIPPASGIYYASDVLRRLNPVQPAYAQEAGTGFRVLGPFLALWRAVRNMVYALFVLGAVILGLAIMFRTKISPQVTMTIQAALPRIIVGLLLVTFSYAIVGFLVDLTYVGVGAFMWALQGAGLHNYNAETHFGTYSNAGFSETVGTIFHRGLASGRDLLLGTVQAHWTIGVSTILGGALSSILLLFVPGVSGAVAAGLVLVLLGLLIAIIFFLIRVLFALARAYIILIIHLVLAPLFILWGTLTGKGVWDSWLKGTLAALLVFPAVGMVIFLADVLIQQLVGARAEDVWGPPYAGRHKEVLQGIIGLGSLVLLPQIPDIINQLLGVRAPRIDLPAIGRQFEPLTRAAQTAVERRIRERPEGERFFRPPWETRPRTERG